MTLHAHTALHVYDCIAQCHVPSSSSHVYALTHFILRLYSGDDCGRTITEITLDSTLLTELAFQRCLEFLYTGYVELKGDSEGLDDTLKAAKIFNLPELQMIIENAQIGDEHLSPSIGTWLNDRNCATAKKLFFNKVR